MSLIRAAHIDILVHGVGGTHRCECTGSRPSQSIASLGWPHDSAVANDDHIPPLELLLKLTDQPSLDLKNILPHSEGELHDKCCAAGLDLHLFHTANVDLSHIGLDFAGR